MHAIRSGLPCDKVGVLWGWKAVSGQLGGEGVPCQHCCDGTEWQLWCSNCLQTRA